MELNKMEQSFKLNNFNTEDDVKIHFHSDIVKPLLEEVMLAKVHLLTCFAKIPNFAKLVPHLEELDLLISF